MRSPFVSLNSWDEPGTILQAAGPEEMIEGGPDEIEKLRFWLARRNRVTGDTIHPQSGAVGYFTYEGAFRFGWFRALSVLKENGTSPFWNERRAHFDGGLDFCGRMARQPNAGGVRGARGAGAGIHRGGRHLPGQSRAEIHHAFCGKSLPALRASARAQSGAGRRRFSISATRACSSASPELFPAHPRPAHHDAADQGDAAAQPRPGPRRAARLRAADRSEGAGRAGDDHRSGAQRSRADLRVWQRGGDAARATGAVRAGLPSRLDGRGHAAARRSMRSSAVRACIPGRLDQRRAETPGLRDHRANWSRVRAGFTPGSIGYFDDNGDAAFSLAIRTMVLEGDELHFSVGSGITAGSVPAREYEETLHKAAGMRAGAWRRIDDVSREARRAVRADGLAVLQEDLQQIRRGLDNVPARFPCGRRGASAPG